FERLERRVSRGTGVDQSRLALGRPNQDRIALADVENFDGDWPGREVTEQLGAGGFAFCEKGQRDEAEGENLSCRLLPHIFISPPGSRLERSSCTRRVSFASLAVAAASISSESVITSPGLAPAGKSDLGTFKVKPSSFTRTAICLPFPSKRSNDSRVGMRVAP